MDDSRYFTLTSTAGKFIFPRPTIMSHAKLIRDTVTGALMTRTTKKPPFTPDTVVRWVRETVMGPAKDTQFEWVL